MSEASNTYLPCIYEEAQNDETTLDLSYKDLETVPNISNKIIRMLYLQNNRIAVLPEDFFPSLTSLMWLDIRDNQLTDIPKSIENHPSLTHLLLQNNNLTTLPTELGTVVNLKVLQLKGNPLVFPPQDIINAGTAKLLQFLHDKHVGICFAQSQSEISEDAASSSDAYPPSIFDTTIRSYNSVIEQNKLKSLSVKFNEKEVQSDASEVVDCFGIYNGKKCPRLAESRSTFAPKTRTKPLFERSKEEIDAKIRKSYMKDLTLKKHKDLVATRDKILQDRKNSELLGQWRRNYRDAKHLAKASYKMANFPYDTHPDYMTLLTREDIEKDLPDKYKKRLPCRSKPTVPRKNSPGDMHLAMRIKQLFENLESIDVNRANMTPRTEQRVLLNEIHKISEIKQKLKELSVANKRSVDIE